MGNIGNRNRIDTKENRIKSDVIRREAEKSEGKDVAARMLENWDDRRHRKPVKTDENEREKRNDRKKIRFFENRGWSTRGM